MIPTATKKELSVDEAELYDRQIRLWGITSQERLRAANILLIGANSLGSEIAKNVLLSGINSLTILDPRVAKEEDVAVNMFVTNDDLGKNLAEAVARNAQELNPLVKIEVIVEPLSKQTEDVYKKFTLIVATGLAITEIIAIDHICIQNGIKFITGDAFGMFGCSVLDLQDHKYHTEQVKLKRQKRKLNSKEEHTTTEKVEKTIVYPPLEKLFKFPLEQSERKRKRINSLYYLMIVLFEFREKEGRDPSYEKRVEDTEKLSQIQEDVIKRCALNKDKLNTDVFKLVFGEIAPVSSVVGGIIAQEVIKAISESEVPIHNVFLFDPNTYSGFEQSICT